MTIRALIAVLFILASQCSQAKEELLINPPKGLEITIKIADTPEKMAWGLMGVSSLEPNQGMLFLYKQPRIASIWMFNVLIDLSIAFVDEENTIRELHNAEAFPAMLGPSHRLSNVYQLSSLSLNDPVVRFFKERMIESKGPVSYTLELNKGWFDKNGVSIGDVIEWKASQNHVVIWPAIDLGPFIQKEDSTFLSLKEESPLCVTLKEEVFSATVSFLDKDKQEIEKIRLKKDKSFFCRKYAKYILISINSPLTN